MSKEALLKYQEFRRIMKLTSKFLQTNKEEIINNGISEILKNKEKLYTYELEGRTLQKFKHGISTGHFQWIIERCTNSTIEFNDYTSNVIHTLQPAYIDFYTSLIKLIPSFKQPKEVQENLEDFFNILKNKYS